MRLCYLWTILTFKMQAVANVHWISIPRHTVQVKLVDLLRLRNILSLRITSWLYFSFMFPCNGQRLMKVNDQSGKNGVNEANCVNKLWVYMKKKNKIKYSTEHEKKKWQGWGKKNTQAPISSPVLCAKLSLKEVNNKADLLSRTTEQSTAVNHCI